MRTFTGLIAGTAALLALAGCEDEPAPAPPPPPPAGLPLFGDGYRGDGDACRRVGESEVTAEFLDDAADLVACPVGTDPGLFASETGGREVARHMGYILFSVPRR
ncbi:hypothetical protein [Pseudoruegeria sp. HB172150]|uniref:hypothetical protein n=1 Tax=Pseudoruegeria sp. HB172150 TaxID=2721164 RepID=UPI001553A6A1|nr:hypothetical protein [Pseudoruegeria sp. HB172150]